MQGEPSRVLSVAARSGRLGCVLLSNRSLERWKTSECGARGGQEAVAKLRIWIVAFKPQVLVSENPDRSRKGGRQQAILRSIASAGDDLPLRNLVVVRQRPFRNAYVEAQHFAEQFPVLATHQREKPPIWEKEPYGLVIFEALALARDAGCLDEAGAG